VVLGSGSVLCGGKTLLLAARSLPQNEAKRCICGEDAIALARAMIRPAIRCDVPDDAAFGGWHAPDQQGSAARPNNDRRTARSARAATGPYLC